MHKDTLLREIFLPYGTEIYLKKDLKNIYFTN